MLLDALRADDAAQLRRAIALGENVNAFDLQSGESVLGYAIAHRRVTCASILLKCGAKPDTPSQKDGRYPVHRACFNGDVTCLDLLMASGADIDIRDLSGNSPLHFASKYGHLQCCVRLVTNGAEVHATNTIGETPMVMARMRSHSEVAEYLSNAASQATTRAQQPRDWKHAPCFA